MEPFKLTVKRNNVNRDHYFKVVWDLPLLRGNNLLVSNRNTKRQNILQKFDTPEAARVALRKIRSAFNQHVKAQKALEKLK